MNPRGKILIIDSYSILFRVFFGMRTQYKFAGVYGFFSVLRRVLKFNPDGIYFVLDTGYKTWRHDLYAGYKNNRSPTPDDLIPQFKILRACLASVDAQCISQKGQEADDCIASLCKIYYHSCESIIIVSSDKDLMQLVNNKVSLYDPFAMQQYDSTGVFNKLSVWPEQVKDYLGFVGDASDNVPGVPGIGSKTAASWLQTYGCADNILRNLHQLTPLSRQRSLAKNIHTFTLSRQLVALNNTISFSCNLMQHNSTVSDENCLAIMKRYNQYCK